MPLKTPVGTPMWWYMHSNEQGHPRLSFTPIWSTCASHRAFLWYTWAVTRAFLPYCTPKLANYVYYLIFVRYLTLWNLGETILQSEISVRNAIQCVAWGIGTSTDGWMASQELRTPANAVFSPSMAQSPTYMSGRERSVALRPYPSLAAY